jgi:hypothetical protein
LVCSRRFPRIPVHAVRAVTNNRILQPGIQSRRTSVDGGIRFAELLAALEWRSPISRHFSEQFRRKFRRKARIFPCSLRAHLDIRAFTHNAVSRFGTGRNMSRSRVRTKA